MKKQILFLITFAGMLNYTNAQWISTNKTAGGQIDGDVNCLIKSGVTILAGTSGGVSYSINNGSSWIAMTAGMIGSGQTFAINGNNIFAGTSDGVFLATVLGKNWTKISAGLTSPNVTALAISGSNIFAGSGYGGTNGGIFLSSDNGKNWSAVNNGLPTKTIVEALAINGNNIFAGTYGNGIYLSSNNGGNWTPVDSGLTNLNISAIAVNENNIFAGTHGKGVFLSTNNGKNWTPVDSGLLSLNVYSLITSGKNIFAGTKLGVFSSADNGNSWKIVGNWPPPPFTSGIVTSLVVCDNELYAGIGDEVFLFKNWNNAMMIIATTTVALDTARFTDSRDGKIYKTVKIGTQTWMAENLNYASSPSWCYDGSSSNCIPYGRLYSWYVANKVCPSGWHLSSNAEWRTLTTYLGGEDVAGGKLKSISTWSSPNTGATNSSGFTALPSGYCDYYGIFGDIGNYSHWWSSIENGPNNAWYWDMDYDASNVHSDSNNKNFGYSVRCLRDL